MIEVDVGSHVRVRDSLTAPLCSSDMRGICVGYVLILDRASTSCQYLIQYSTSLWIMYKQDGGWRMADGRKIGKLQVEYLTVVTCSYEQPR